MLTRELNNVSNTHKTNYEQLNHAYSSEQPIKLLIELEQFHATDKATVVTKGRYILLNDNGKKIVDSHFEISEALSRDGYLHAVEQLKKTVLKLSEKITIDVDRVLTN